MGPAGDTTPASKLHGAYDDQYLLRLVSQEGRPGIFAFETCLHDQGIARQGTCVSALRNLKGEPVPISIEVIASEQLSSKEVEVLAAVKREHRKYTSALATRARENNLYGKMLPGAGLVIGGGVSSLASLDAIADGLTTAGDVDVDPKELKAKVTAKSNELVETSRAFDRFLATSEEMLKQEVARQAEYLGDYADSRKIRELRKNNMSVDLAKELKNYNINSHSTRSIFNQDLVKWLDETGLPEPLRMRLQATGLSIDSYLRKPSTFDVLISDKYGNNKQAFDEIVRMAMREWPEIAPYPGFSHEYLLDFGLKSRLGYYLDDIIHSLGGGAYTAVELLKTDLRGYIARLDEFRVEFPTRFKTQAAYRAMLRNYELNAVRIHSYERWEAANDFLDALEGRVRKGAINNSDAYLFAYRMADTYDQPKGKRLYERLGDLNRDKAFAQKKLLGYLADTRGKVAAGIAGIAGIAAIGLGFGMMINGHRSSTQSADDHRDDWQALLESGQVDLITDFSSSLWTPDATEHTDVPSVKELMIYLTLFQRELWFGETSDAPDVVQIVRHCLPRKARGGIRAQCESVVGT